MQNFDIYGNGAVGNAVAYFLKNYPCNLHSKTSKLQDISIHGKLYPLKKHTSKNSLHIVCTKAFSVTGCIDKILKNNTNPEILVLSNGYLNHQLKPYKNIHRGVVLFGVSQSNDTYNIISKNPVIKIFDSLADLLITLPSVFSSEKNCGFLGEKFFFNVILNTLCSAYQLQHNELVRIIPKTLLKVSKEAFELTKKLHPDFQQPKSVMFKRLDALIDSVSKNQNSMYTDFIKKRPSERSYLSGMSVGLQGFETLKALDNVIHSTERSTI